MSTKEQAESNDDELITAQCADCDEVKPVHPDTGLCDDCEDYYLYCTVCEEHYHEDQTCRHIFWDRRAGAWVGPGADEPCYQKIEKYRAAVVFVLQQHHPALVTKLAEALRAGRAQKFFGDTVSFAIASCQIACGLNQEDCLAFDVGREWLQALDNDTPRETALVLEWIAELQKGVVTT